MRRVGFVAAAFSLGSFVLYAVLAARDVMFGDGPELTAAAVTNGVAHPPGYPLWIVLGHLASLIPVGTLAYRVNLTACAYHALTVGLVFATAYVLTRRLGAAAFAAVLLALDAPLFVSWSLQAEVFSLNDCFAAAIVLLCVAWLADPRRWRAIAPLLGALFGLGLSNQQTLIALAPVALWAAWCGRKAITSDARLWRTAGLAAIALVLGFALPYAHTLIASRHLSDLTFGTARTLPQLVDLIERKAYGGFRLVALAGAEGGTFGDRFAAMVEAFGWPFAFVAAGVAAL
ncbi:MAG TPA: DUF2723 domain-containing protein, partial [Candidatus Baltobacteraceae bacterium]|nr:DUF2723 domain-containing protein [Candidatus Baltobacteraceae bacterium]